MNSHFYNLTLQNEDYANVSLRYYMYVGAKFEDRFVTHPV